MVPLRQSTGAAFIILGRRFDLAGDIMGFERGDDDLNWVCIILVEENYQWASAVRVYFGIVGYSFTCLFPKIALPFGSRRRPLLGNIFVVEGRGESLG